MSPRRRLDEHADLPPHVQVNNVNGVSYFRYVMPDGVRYNLGKNKAEAIFAALSLNAELSRNPEILLRIMQRQEAHQIKKNLVPDIGFALDKFAERLDQKKYAKTTRTNINQMLNKYRQQWQGRQVDKITHLDITGFLNQLTPHAYLKHKNLMVDFWGFMLHQGWCSENWPAKTMNAILPDKQRTRHTLESVLAIRAIAPDYMQRAIDLALHSLQRRADLASMQRKAVNMPKNSLIVLQQKTVKYANPVYIEIDMHPELCAAVTACLSTRLASQCPYLLHYRPKRMNDQIANGKRHKFAMTEGFLTKEFSHWRDESGVYDHLPLAMRPSFHDLRALGIVLITEKYGKDYAMALAGHADERMWKHYTSGHVGYDTPKPVQISFKSG